jgi:thiol-disulfide isomerase/thioredoxin
MKKVIIALVMLALPATLLLAQKQAEPDNQTFYRAIGSDLPELRVVDGKMKEYTNRSFKDARHFFLIMFNPTCGHCIKMTKEIGAHAALFKDNHVLFLAGAQMMPYFQDFYKETEVFKHPEFVVAVDSAQTIEKLYSYRTLPQINVYDKDRKLVKTYNGDVPLDSLKQYLW